MKSKKLGKWIQVAEGCGLEVAWKAAQGMGSQETEVGFQVEGEGTDEQTFSCKTCEYKHKKEGPMKSHITRQHVKKQKAPEGAGIVETEEAAIAALDEWDRPRTGEKVVEEEVEDEDDTTMNKLQCTLPTAT